MNGNAEEICETVAETRRLKLVFAVGMVTLVAFPLLRSQRNRTIFLPVSVRFQLKGKNVSASVTSC